MPTSNGLNFSSPSTELKTSISPLKILFLTDNSAYQNSLSSTQDIFCAEASALFEKMIQAMNIASKDFAVKLINSQDDWKNIIVESKALVVAPLGASATLAVLEGEKLSKVRGQIIPRAFQLSDKVHQTKVVPLFHPDFLLINPAMKRTAWIDLQLIMKLILN